MVDATARAGIGVRRLAWVSARVQLGWASVVADVAALLGGYLVADAASAFILSARGAVPTHFAPGWPAAVFVAVVVAVFYALGLYELEAYVSRPLHLWTLLKASAATFALSSLLIYLISFSVFDESRVVFLLTFVVFLLLSCVVRLGVLDGLCGVWVRQRKPVSVLVGESDAVRALAMRLGDLRGFDRVEHVTPAALHLDAQAALERALEQGRPAEPWVASVFVDASCMTPHEAFEASVDAQAMGAEVYMASGLLEAAEGNRLLSKLFGMPVIRVRRSIDEAKPYALKRVFDIVGSAILLLLAAPVIAVLAVIIRLTSPGPVFYHQTRVGRSGVPFEFLKLRSMVVDGDVSIHENYVKAFMNGSAEAVAVEVGGEAIYKKLDDPRITSVGRFIRKYSLDELPQFWNVFRGDMSLVGPRPSLPYEVEEYDGWASLRMAAPAGITGLWQVEGRSRVSFDEMILQDLMYAQNMRLLVDVGLCLKTLPATLLGGGGG